MVCGLYKTDPNFIILLNKNSEIDVYKWLENICKFIFLVFLFLSISYVI